MRLPRMRFTVRRMMLAVAFLALVLGGSVGAIRLKQRRDAFVNLAFAHAHDEDSNRSSEKSARRMVEIYSELRLPPSMMKQIEDFNRSKEKSARDMEEFYNKLPSKMKQIIDALTKISGPGSQDSSKRKVPVFGPRDYYSRHGLRGTRRPTLIELAEHDKVETARERDRAATYAEAAAYHAALKEKYLRAGARPWWSVDPDPPPPDPAGRGRYLSERGEYSRALAGYEEAIKLDPKNGFALNGLAWLLATRPEAQLRDGRRAVELATRACELTFRADEACVDTLAAAHAEAGDFKAAVESQREAIGLLSQGDPSLEHYRARLDAYKANKPFREVPKKGE